LNIVWLKRDLRLSDHLPLLKASSDPFIFIYIFEPSVSFNYDFDIRHWRFVFQSIKDMESTGAKVHCLYGEALDVFRELSSRFKDITVYSHTETGNDLTYSRDIEVGQFFKTKNFRWHEFSPYGVIRGLKHRDGWDQNWIQYVKSSLVKSGDLTQMKYFDDLNESFKIPNDLLPLLESIEAKMVTGGENFAKKMLDDFIGKKVESYWGSLSYPEKSNYFSSKLSAYLAWGNISIKQIYQTCLDANESVSNKKSLNQFMARLKWHCHFIQKLESEPRIEFENLNTAFNGIRQKKDKKKIKAWKEGRTGYPLIDAAMRCVAETGYLNFRLRATVVSFLTHSLWQPWQAGAGFLARQFLDYEPGIHFSQFQMQAGTTGINTLRIYNPVKQSKEKDKEGEFIKRWIPELRDLPIKFIHEPWLLTEMDELMYNFKLGRSYPKRIVDIDVAHKEARDILWSTKDSKSSKRNSKSILKKHAKKRNHGNHR
jgi:deoxyribodipyrimidine photo-lyase